MRGTAKDRANRKRFPLSLTLVCAISILSGCITWPPTTEIDPPPGVIPEIPPPCPQLSGSVLVRNAIEHLDHGEPKPARTLLDCAIVDNPGSYAAKLLIRELEEDPATFFPDGHYIYTVNPGETLSRIAEEKLDNGLLFVILARYNNIKVPADLVGGQRIKIPGSPETELLLSDALDCEQQGDLECAYGILKTLTADKPDVAELDVHLERVRKALITELENRAWALEADIKVDKAVETWQRILEIDPHNFTAQLSIQRLTR